MKRADLRKGAAALVVATLVGCAGGPNEQAGAVIGGVLGGALGSQVGEGKGRTAAIILGTMAGSMIGGSIGRYMDEQDKMKTAQALEYNPTGKSSEWVNPDTGNAYEVTPTRTYEKAGGQPCREFTMEATIGGKQEEVYGTACRQPDGSWQIVK